MRKRGGPLPSRERGSVRAMNPNRSSKLPMRVVRSWRRAPSRPSSVHARFSVPPAVSNVTRGCPSSCSSNRCGGRAAVQPDVEDVRDRRVGRGRRGRLALPLDRPRGVHGAAQEGHGEAGVAPAIGELVAKDAARPALLPACGEDGRGRLGRRPGGRQERRPARRSRSRSASRHSGSRWTVSGEKAGAHTATYSAPPSSGVL